MKMKVMRDNPAMLQAAIAVANAEQNLRRRIDLRSGLNHMNQWRLTRRNLNTLGIISKATNQRSVNQVMLLLIQIIQKIQSGQCISRGDLVSTGRSKKEKLK